MSTVDNKRQMRSEKKKKDGKQWLKWLCNPTALSLFIQVGKLIVDVVKLIQWFSER